MYCISVCKLTALCQFVMELNTFYLLYSVHSVSYLLHSVHSLSYWLYSVHSLNFWLHSVQSLSYLLYSVHSLSYLLHSVHSQESAVLNRWYAYPWGYASCCQGVREKKLKHCFYELNIVVMI